MAHKLAIIEDDPLIALDLEALCEGAGWTVVAIARSLDEVKCKLGNEPLDMVVSDMELIGPGDGVDAVSWIQQKNPELSIIFVTGTCKEEHLKRIKHTAPRCVFTKPLDASSFVAFLSGMQI
ncbi:hypothetical protein LCGC14_0045490 [marine sediment metagenome]|uniref:Response regulator n=2 Tax=root TaxID=1 RepID=A0A7V1BHZ8_9RHOB|nr:response regulator [Sulfitobacter litoralis]HDZ53594.1 response regulator [Sulfitobacter litoralis]